MVAEKKKCPYCERVIGRAGWAMHYSTKHVEREFKAFDKVGAPAGIAESGDKSFRERRKPEGRKPREREGEPDESEEGGDDDWGTLLDD